MAASTTMLAGVYKGEYLGLLFMAVSRIQWFRGCKEGGGGVNKSNGRKPTSNLVLQQKSKGCCNGNACRCVGG